jgi:hypothetical protein
MKPRVQFTHKFVEFIPAEVEERTLYVSVEYATATHKCACGCGNKVVTPLTPKDWTLSYDGETVSLDPSIGNWSFPCQSHYWLRGDQAEWAPQWSKREIKAGREADRERTKEYYARKSPAPAAPVRPATRWERVRRWWSGK